MAQADFTLARNYKLRLIINVKSQSIANNTTTYTYSLRIIKGDGTGRWADGPHYWSVRSPAGTVLSSGSIGSYDFRNYSELVLKGNTDVTFSGSGSRTFRGVFDDGDTWGELGDGTVDLSITPPSIPAKPSGLTATRVSDSQISLAWSGSGSSTVVQRRVDGGSWTEVGRPGSSPTSWTNTGTQANRKYDYRVANVGGAGQSGWSNTATVYTTPAPVGSVSAVRDGMDILVTASSLPPHATAYDVYDSATLVGSDVTSWPWRHAAPNPAVTHTYRVVSKRDALVSAQSAPSNTVQLQTPPNAPSGLAPNGGLAASDGDVRFTWTHNPVDTSAQTVYELRYRVGAAAWTTVSGTTASFRDVPLGVATYDWQVRTKGDHPDWSDWSAVATVTLVNRPGAAVLTPGASFDQPVLPVSWSYLQLQGRPQSGWRVELLDSTSTRLEHREGSGAQSSLTLAHRLEHGHEYTVLVWVATGTVWSAPAAQTFTVTFDPPSPPILTGEWDEGAGAHNISIQVGDIDPLGVILIEGRPTVLA